MASIAINGLGGSAARRSRSSGYPAAPVLSRSTTSCRQTTWLACCATTRHCLRVADGGYRGRGRAGRRRPEDPGAYPAGPGRPALAGTRRGPGAGVHRRVPPRGRPGKAPRCRAPVSREEVSDAFREEAASDRYPGILGVAGDPVVSADIVGDPRASVVDTAMPRVVDGTLVKGMSWYANEWGFTCQMIRETYAALGMPAPDLSQTRP